LESLVEPELRDVVSWLSLILKLWSRVMSKDRSPDNLAGGAVSFAGAADEYLHCRSETAQRRQTGRFSSHCIVSGLGGTSTLTPGMTHFYVSPFAIPQVLAECRSCSRLYDLKRSLHELTIPDNRPWTSYDCVEAYSRCTGPGRAMGRYAYYMMQRKVHGPDSGVE
jgi:hypothetical protein